MRYARRAAAAGVAAVALTLGVAPAGGAASTQEPPQPRHPDELYLPLHPEWSYRPLILELPDRSRPPRLPEYGYRLPLRGVEAV